MVILSPKLRKEALNSLLSGFIRDHLITEADNTGIARELATTSNVNFLHHADHVADLIAKGIFPEFVDFGNGIAVYKIKSSDWKLGHGIQDNEYFMAIRFYDWNKFFDDPQLNLVQRVNQLAKGNLGIMCGCPSFQYHYGYAANQKDSEFYDAEHRNYMHTLSAPIRNPQKIGLGCKHLDMLLNRKTYISQVLHDVYRAIASKLPSTGADRQELNKTPHYLQPRGPKQPPVRSKEMVSPSAPNSKRNQFNTPQSPQYKAVLKQAGMRNPAPHSPNVGRMKYLDVEPKIKESIDKELDKKLLLIESPLANGIPEGFSLLIEDQEIIEEDHNRDPTRAIGNYITRLILKYLKSKKIEDHKVFIIDLMDIDPNLHIIKTLRQRDLVRRQIKGATDNTPNLTKLAIHVNMEQSDQLSLGNAYFSGTLTLEFFIKGNPSTIELDLNHNFVAQLANIVEHELRHWYQFIVKEPLAADTTSDKFTDDFLRPAEIDSYLRGWIKEMAKLKITNVQFAWDYLLTDIYSRMYTFYSKLPGKIDTSFIIDTQLNKNFANIAFNHLSKIYPNLAKQIKKKYITTAELANMVDNNKNDFMPQGAKNLRQFRKAKKEGTNE